MGQDLANIGARAPAPEESPSPAGAASPAAQGAAASTAAAQAASPSAPRSGGLQLARRSLGEGGSAVFTSDFACNSARRITREFACATVERRSQPPLTGTSPASAASPNASPPPGQRTGVASPSPGQMANTTPGGSSPAAPSAQTPGAPWPIQTAGLPPMYSAAWHHVHLYAPRSINPDSNMPAYRFLYEKRRIAGERSAEALQLSASDAPPEGWEVVPTYDAKCVVAYLMGLNQSHPLKEVRSVGGAPATGGAPAPAVQGASPAPAAGGSPAAPKK